LLMMGNMPVSGSEALAILQSEEKFRIFNWGGGMDWRSFLSDPYIFWIAVFGGAVFSVASHGTDQLIVQRMLATRKLRDSQRAMIWSGVAASLQFAFFLGIGLLLYIFYQGMSPAELNLQTADEVFAKFIVEEIPPGIAGLIIAALMAAAMSSLSSSLSALASATTFDILKQKWGADWTIKEELLTSRLTTIFWGFILTGSALFFTWLQLSGGERPAIVELGLGIASYTYGGLLGVFLLGLLFPKPDKTDAMIGFFIGLISLLFMVEGPVQNVLPGEGLAVAWPLYTLVGAVIVIAAANIMQWVRRD
jgi:solute:Na+ symporter, SSS family